MLHFWTEGRTNSIHHTLLAQTLLGHVAEEETLLALARPDKKKEQIIIGAIASLPLLHVSIVILLLLFRVYVFTLTFFK